MRVTIELRDGQFGKATKISELQFCAGRFIIAQCGQQKFETKTVKTVKPCFGETFSFDILPSERPLILLEYYEKIRMKNDIYKAFVMVDTNTLKVNETTSRTVEFSNGGTLNVNLHLCY